jgi:hypothetical protein
MTSNLLSRFSTHVIVGVSWIIAWQHVLYADQLPGDGFTAGILLLIALMQEFVIVGYRKASQKLPDKIFHVALVLGIGLLTALLVLPPLFSEEAQLLESFDIPLFGTQFSSTLIFETAIFVLVGGGALSYIVSSREVEP